MIWVTWVFIVFFDVFGLILMLVPGILPRFVAIACYIYPLPLIAGQQVIWTEGPLAIASVSLPALTASVFFSFQTMMVYVATVNFLEQMGRDYLGRKREKPNR